MGAESKYSLRLAAVDAYSATFGDFKQKAGGLQDVMKLQQAELKKLNDAARSAEGYTRLGEKLKTTRTALEAARIEQAKTSREHATATAKVAQLTAEQKQAAASLKTLGASSEATAAQVRAATAEESRLARELKTATAELGRLDQAQDKATAGVKTLQAAQRAQVNELRTLKASLSSAGVDTGKLAAEQKRLEAATESANAALAAQKAKLEAVKGAQQRIEANRDKRGELRGQMVETAALAYVASRPVSQAMDLETAMADVGKVINFEEGGKEAMASANLKLASDRLIASSGMTALDLAKIEYAAGQSGIGNDIKDKDGNVDVKAKTASVMDFTRDAAIMGSAFDIDAQTAGETMAGWRASMGLDRSKTLDLADATNYLGNNFNAKAADIAAVVKRFGAVGKASGLTPEQSAALSAALLNPGTEKEIAGTGFKNFTSALVAGKSATKGEKEQWKELGFDPEDLAGDMQKNAPETIMRVLEAIKEQPVEEQAAIATNLFGSESIGAIQPLLENLGEVRRAFGMVADKSKYATSVIGEQGSMMQEAAGVANTSRTGWNSFTARLTRLSTVIGNAMLPVLNAVLTPLGVLVDMVSSAAETFPGITGALAVAAAGLTALKVGALGLKFVGLLFGQAFNRGSLARAKLNASTVDTARQANAAVARLNATLGRVGGGPGAAGAGGAARSTAGGGAAAGARAARTGRLARLAAAGGKVLAPVAAVLGAAGLAGGAFGSMQGALSTVPMPGGAAPAAAGQAPRVPPKLTLVPPGVAPSPLAPAAAAIASPASRLTLVPTGGAPGAPGAPAAAGQAPRGPAKLSLVPPGVARAPLAPAAAVLTPAATRLALPSAAGTGGAAGAAGAGAAAGAAGATGATGATGAAAAAGASKAPGMLGKAAASAAPIGKLVSKLATPLMLVSGAVTAAEGLAEGNTEKVGGAVGGMGGALAGASMGAAIGTAILPGIGTAVGGAVGGLAGSGVGEWIGERLGSLFDRLKTPDATAKEVAESAPDKKPSETVFAPVIHLTPTGLPAYDQQLIDQIMARLKAELLGAPGMGGGQLAERRSASLSDGSS